ncbi:MAG: alpha/beta fold hydrolase [Ferruginibacter sp.]
MQHILLLHGAIGAKDQLQSLAGRLNKNYTVHTLNFNGHGANPVSTYFSIEGFAEDVRSYMEQHDISQAAIFGYSMGGYVAMWLGRYYPQMISRIITLATKFHWDEETAAKETKLLDADTIEEKVPVFAEQLRQRHGAENWRSLLEKTKGLLQQLGNKNALELSAYANIPIPSLLLLGDKDKMVTTAETIAVQHALPNAKYRSLPNTVHPIEMADVEMLAGIIEEFVQ